MQIDMNFVEDVRLGLSADLQELGYDLPEPTGNARMDAHRVCVEHWNAYARRIPVRPRDVHWSRELRAREQVLSVEIRNGLAAVEREIQAGDDLTARLSRRLGRRAFNDLLLNDWGIHHLHLDAVDRARGTREVLFLLLRPEHAYLIDVRHHGAWADGDLLEILHANWPAEIARFGSRALRMRAVLTDEQRRRLRDKGVYSPSQTKDGTVYLAIGGGYATTGTNIMAVRWSDYTLGTAQRIEEFLRGQVSWLSVVVEHETGTQPDRVALHLMHLSKDHALVFVEHSTRPFAFRVPIEEPPNTLVDLTSMPTP